MKLRTCSGVAAALACLLLSAGCSDRDVTAPNATKMPIAADVVLPGTSSCAAIKAANPAAADGEYTIQFAPHKSFTAYCVMSVEPARDYLTLPAGPNFNYSNYADASGGPGLTTRWSRVRVRLADFYIDVNDLTFATSSGSAYHCGNAAEPVHTMSYGSAMSCSSVRGRMRIDLNGTPFTWGTTNWFTLGGRGAANGWTTSVNRKFWQYEVYSSGSGTAAWISTTWVYPPFNRVGENWALGLTYAGAFTNQLPVISISTTAAEEGSAVAIAVGLSDADGDPVTITSYNLGDGSTGTGPPPASHVYADNGDYTITVVATDGYASKTQTHVVHVANVTPAVSTIAGAQLLVGEVYTGEGTFTDPGADTWTATADYGFGAQSLALSGNAFALQYTYNTAGTFTVRVAVTDDDAGTGEGTATVVVLSPAQGSEVLAEQVEQLLAAGSIAANDAKPLAESVAAAMAALQKGNQDAALGKLGAFDNKLKAMLNSRRINEADYGQLLGYSQKLQRSIKG